MIIGLAGPDARRRARRVAPLLGLLFLAACSDRPGEDVRIGFCRALTMTQLPPGTAIDWRDHQARPAGYEDLRVRLRFAVPGRQDPLTAECAYPYRAVDENALTLADPLAAYGTSPTAMTFDGRPLSREALALAIRDAAVLQARGALEQARAALDPPPRP